MLTGASLYSLDKKGRVVIPATFRSAVPPPYRLTVTADGALLLRKWDHRQRRVPAETVFRIDRVSPETGRVTLPAWVRERFGLRPGCDVVVKHGAAEAQFQLSRPPGLCPCCHRPLGTAPLVTTLTTPDVRESRTADEESFART